MNYAQIIGWSSFCLQHFIMNIQLKDRYDQIRFCDGCDIMSHSTSLTVRQSDHVEYKSSIHLFWYSFVFNWASDNGWLLLFGQGFDYRMELKFWTHISGELLAFWTYILQFSVNRSPSFVVLNAGTRRPFHKSSLAHNWNRDIFLLF